MRPSKALRLRPVPVLDQQQPGAQAMSLFANSVKEISPDPQIPQTDRSEGASATAIEVSRRAAFGEIIAAWIENRRREDALSRQEIAELDALNRLLAQRHSLIDNLGHFFSVTQRADVATGILVLITFLSDNNAGCCTLSVPRIAQFFRRSERAVIDAIGRLEAAEVIFVERSNYRSSRYWPSINRLFGGQQTPLIWFFDARAPRKAPLKSASGVGIYPRSQLQSPLKPASPNTTNKTTNTKKGSARAKLFEGKIVLNPDARKYWLSQFGDDERLDLALLQAEGYVKPNSSVSLDSQVESQLALIAGDKLDRDKRHAASLAATTTRSPTGRSAFSVVTVAQPPREHCPADAYHRSCFRLKEPDRFEQLLAVVRADGSPESKRWTAFWEKFGCISEEGVQLAERLLASSGASAAIGDAA